MSDGPDEGGQPFLPPLDAGLTDAGDPEEVDLASLGAQPDRPEFPPPDAPQNPPLLGIDQAVQFETISALHAKGADLDDDDLRQLRAAVAAQANILRVGMGQDPRPFSPDYIDQILEARRALCIMKDVVTQAIAEHMRTRMLPVEARADGPKIELRPDAKAAGKGMPNTNSSSIKFKAFPGTGVEVSTPEYVAGQIDKILHLLKLGGEYRCTKVERDEGCDGFKCHIGRVLSPAEQLERDLSSATFWHRGLLNAHLLTQMGIVPEGITHFLEEQLGTLLDSVREEMSSRVFEEIIRQFIVDNIERINEVSSASIPDGEKEGVMAARQRSVLDQLKSELTGRFSGLAIVDAGEMGPLVLHAPDADVDRFRDLVRKKIDQRFPGSTVTVEEGPREETWARAEVTLADPPQRTKLPAFG